MRCIGATDFDIQKSIGGGLPRCVAPGLWPHSSAGGTRKREFIAYAQTEAQTELRQGGIALGGLGRVY